MKKLLLPLIAAACLLPAVAFAHSNVSIGVGLGFPAYAPAPVYYAPPAVYEEPVYYSPAPVYYRRPVVYGPTVYYRGYHGRPYCPPRYHGHGHYRHW